MCPWRDSMLFAQCKGLSHDSRVTCMITAGDVGRTEEGNHLFIKAECIDTEALSHIGIDIYGHFPWHANLNSGPTPHPVPLSTDTYPQPHGSPQGQRGC